MNGEHLKNDDESNFLSLQQSHPSITNNSRGISYVAENPLMKVGFVE